MLKYQVWVGENEQLRGPSCWVLMEEEPLGSRLGKGQGRGCGLGGSDS